MGTTAGRMSECPNYVKCVNTTVRRQHKPHTPLSGKHSQLTAPFYAVNIDPTGRSPENIRVAFCLFPSP